jgi:NADPH-dependent glutamate synthase beta subunit-like oxidoreductase
MRYGIPAYRLPREVLDREIAEIEATGVKIICNSNVESATQLKEQGYDAVFVAIGTHLGAKLPLKGNDLPNVYVNADFLRAINLDNPLPVGEKVVVLGGGNVAIDCAESALRLGAKEVHMACLEAADKMTASEEEIEWAKEDGIIIHNSKTFNEIVNEDGKVTGLSVTGVKNFYFENGQAVIEKEENSDEVIPADTIIFAVGQRPDVTDAFGLRLERGRIVAEAKSYVTTVDGIFAAGDGVTGTQSVIKAIAAAREAVSAIDIYLGGDGNIEEALSPEQNANPCIGKDVTGLADRERTMPTVDSVEARIGNFEPMDHGFGCEGASCEAERCLQCDLRAKLAPQKFWSDYVSQEGEDA